MRFALRPKENLLLTPHRGRAAHDAYARPLPKKNLSAREIEVLQLVAKGSSNKEVGKTLHISTATVKNPPYSHLQQTWR